ncbi:hypothetical protein JOE57_000640 [Microlunatus panaciterrae]|uniref:CARDB domain-containing protein n=1 Tax=Microlunatus panaciterrae TaxID=400768 RepID=A0ABS2RIC2_9ACTN|nr:hypothetical protein [Microlunatus panaciterrae]
MSTGEPATEPTKKPQHPALPMLLAVIGSVAGTLVSNAFDASQNLTLLGATLGAALPPLVSVAGPHTHLRLWTGALIAVIALAVTYGGFTIRDKAMGVQETTFPVPKSQPTRPPQSTPTPTPQTTAQPTSSGSTPTPGVTCEGELCISWTPQQLHCASDPCAPVVTVRSDGTQVLQVTGLKFTGDAADRLWQEGTCPGKSLHQGETCTITVRVKPGPAGHAQLRIQHNLQGPASLVDIDVDASTTATPVANLDLSLFTLPECSVVPGGALSGADNLTIFVAVRNSGPAQLSRLVPFTITSDTGLTGGGNTAVSTGSGFSAMQVDLRPGDYGHAHHFTVTIDPSNEIAERDEMNNTLKVTVSLPARPSQAQDVPCTSP